MTANTSWLTSPNSETRTREWFIRDQPVILSLDKFIVETLVSKYRLTLGELYTFKGPAFDDMWVLREQLNKLRIHLGDVNGK